MKRILITVLALGVLLPMGLALRAQESGGDKLDDLIRDLRKAIRDAESSGAPRTLRFETRSYDVRGLVTPIRDFPGEDEDLIPSGGFGFGFDFGDESEMMPYYEIDAIADMIRDTIAPGSWDELNSVSLSTARGMILVRHTAGVHERIAAMLAELASKAATQVVLHVRVLEITDREFRRAVAAGSLSVLGAEAEERLATAVSDGKAKVVRTGRVACSNTQRVALKDMNSVSYVQDYDVEIAQGAAISDPIVRVVREGLLFDVRPIVAVDGETVILEIRSSVSNCREPLESVVTPCGEIETPVVDLVKVRTTLSVPFGRTAVVGGALKDGDDRSASLILVTPHAVRPGK